MPSNPIIKLWQTGGECMVPEDQSNERDENC